MTVVWLDGAFRDARSAAVSIDDRGFTLGDGLFETMRAYGGRVFRLGSHLRRLARAARRIGIPVPRGLGQAIRAILAANELEDAAVRLTLTRGIGPPGLVPPAPPIPTVLITARHFRPDEAPYDHGVAAVTASGRIDEAAAVAGLKTLGRLEHVTARAEARRAGSDVALLRDAAGHLAEADAANLFLVRDGVLHTPPLDCGVLPGITRATVLELAADHGIATRVAPLPPRALEDAEEAFLTNSLQQLLPLVHADGRAIGTGRPGPLTRRLLDLYRRRVAAP
jgi:branched-chain amino acid aminotransferase